MSHLTSIELQIMDLAALRLGVQRIPGLQWCEGQETFKWYGKFMGDSPVPAGFKVEDYGKCLHAIRVKGDAGAYEVGVVRHPSGKGYALLYDSWLGGLGLEAKIGAGAVKLKQHYGIACHQLFAQRNGFQVQERTLPNGKISVKLVKMSA